MEQVIKFWSLEKDERHLNVSVAKEKTVDIKISGIVIVDLRVF